MNRFNSLFVSLLILLSCSMGAQAVSRVYVETFEKYSIGTEFKVYDAKGNVSTQCKAVVAEDPVTSGNKVLIRPADKPAFWCGHQFLYVKVQYLCI
ncbi:MAG: hypothetical protein MJY79_05665 [Bacteroidaceae bacterium]|nr:hypothetical protein [Bacteroidaceae bacterium]